MLKGKTIIELTDTKTGKKERYEDNNLVTGAINDIILDRKKYYEYSHGNGFEKSNNYSCFYHMFPLYERFFGGIMLLSNNVDETHKYITGEDVVIGSATYGNVYGGLDPQIGSYNETESEINTEEKYVKYVYDFETNQGNGTISSVCLGNYHYIYQAAYGKDYNGDLENSCPASILRASITPFQWGNQYVSYCPRHVLFYNDGGYGATGSSYAIPVLYDDEKDHLIVFEYVSSAGLITSSNCIDTIRLHVYDLKIKTVSLLENITSYSEQSRVEGEEIFRKDFTISPLNYNAYYYFPTGRAKQAFYDKSSGYAYLLGTFTDSSITKWTADKAMTFYKFNLNIDDYNNITMETVEITNKTNKVINIAGDKSVSYAYRNFCIKDNYLYVPVAETTNTENLVGFAKININDSTDVTVFEGKYGYFCDELGDFLYFGDDGEKGGNGTVCFNTKTNKLSYTRIRYNSSKHGLKPVPFKNNDNYCFYTGGYTSGRDLGSTYTTFDLYWYLTTCSRNDYLATINNLAQPVTKTSDKTMKITYILREG